VAKTKIMKLHLAKMGEWKFVKAARYIRTEKPAQHHVLLMLALYADENGYSFPSYENLMDDTSYGSKQTISDAITYLRDELHILTWKQGHSNQYKNIANGYTLSLPTMVALLTAQRAARRAAEDAETENLLKSAESTERVAESTPGTC
jgi:hypothetical protein